MVVVFLTKYVPTVSQNVVTFAIPNAARNNQQPAQNNDGRTMAHEPTFDSNRPPPATWAYTGPTSTPVHS
eukprot:scaffold54527_cov24-Attheya_sp.AAC.1